jgi:hypothetical protein
MRGPRAEVSRVCYRSWWMTGTDLAIDNGRKDVF